MASEKKRRKQARQAQKQQRPLAGPFRHPDGDRRRRGGPTADQATADKRARQQFPGALPPEEPA